MHFSISVYVVSHCQWTIQFSVNFIEQVPSYVMMGIERAPATTVQRLSVSPLGEACSRVDLTAIHEMLEKVGYKDDEGVANEVR